MTEQEFLEELQKINISITEEQQEALSIYADFLLEYNNHTNLTAIKTKEEIYLKHFYDSLTLTKAIDFNEKSWRILDIGSGAGFPGLVLGIVFPNVKITLLDSNHKKIDFLKEIVSKLNQNNIEIIYDRAENYVSKNREKFDYGTSRAVAELRILLELTVPALKVNGKFIAMKSSYEQELKDSSETISLLDCELDDTLEFDLPKESGKRTLLIFTKKKATSKKIPRAYTLIVKKTLKIKDK